jgi:radical SAM superfamily enzyme YgiQ (UPF0313 family)
MRVTLINPPQVFSRFQVAAGITPPLGIAYLASYLRAHGIEPVVVDALGEAPGRVTPFRGAALLRGMDLAQTVAAVPEDTELIGISNLFSFAYPVVEELMVGLKARLPHVPIVLGGPHPGALWERCLRDPNVDFVVSGEGEQPLLELCEHLAGSRGADDLEAVAFRADGRIVHVPQSRTLIRKVEDIPWPARDLLPMENYITTQEAHGPVSSRWTSILSSRGCPYGCTFCESRNTRWRARPASDVVDEMEHCVERWGIRDFHFEDDNMTISRRRIHEMADELERRGMRIDWQTPNGIRASVTDLATLEAMKRSGCRHITLAPESGSRRVLEDIIQKGKDFELDQLVEVAGQAKELGMKVAAYFIIGLPGEREEDVQQTIAYAARLARVGVDEVGFGLFIPLPGTPLWDGLGDRVDSMDLLDLLTVDDLNSSVSFNDHLDDDMLRRLRRKAYATFFLTRLRHHPRAFAGTLRNVVRSRQETKTDRVLISLLARLRGGVGVEKKPVLAYPYDAARTVSVLLHAEAGYAFEQGMRKTLRLLRRRG